MAGKAQTATQTLPYLLQLGRAPVAIAALVRPVQVLVIGADDELAGAALGTDQLAVRFEFAERADVGAGEMMDEPLLAEMARSAVGAAAAKGRQAAALGTELHAVPDDGL